MKIPSFTHREKWIFAGCFFSYMLCYTGRMNLGPVLGAIQSEIAVSSAHMGLIQTVFAAIYAIGQLVNGSLADRTDPRRHITTGLVLSALCNLLFGLCRSYGQMLACWGLNGIAQSMLWTSVVRVIVISFDKQQRSFVNLAMCVCFTLGHLLAWAVSGLLAAVVSWRGCFFVPAGLLALTAVFAFCTLPGQKADPIPKAAHTVSMSIPELLSDYRIWLIFLACVTTGFGRDGVMTWAPKLISEAGETKIAAAASSLLIPLLNMTGILTAQVLLRKQHGNIRSAIRLLLAAAAICCISIAAVPSVSGPVLALLLGMMCSLMYSSSSLLNVMLPMEYAYTGRAALIAGVCDCMFYLGAALVSVVSGALLDSLGRAAMYLVWTAAAVVSCILMIPSSERKSHTA